MMYRPKEIIVVKDVKNHPETCSILDKCPGVPVRVVDSNQPDVRDTVKRMFTEVTPERITIGTLRFEEEFYKNRYALVGQISSGRQLLIEMDKLQPMLPSMQVPTGRQDKTGEPKMKSSIGKYSYPQKLRLEMFSFVISEIRKYFDGLIALCKEVRSLWLAVGFDPRRCRCVCQFDEANLFNSNEFVHAGTHLPRNKTLV